MSGGEPKATSPKPPPPPDEPNRAKRGLLAPSRDSGRVGPREEREMYSLIWDSQYGKEEIESEIETREEAEYLRAEYQLAYGELWQIRCGGIVSIVQT